jgi:hypothetical protein
MADHEPLTTGTKTCPKCKQTKSVLAFAASRKNKGGLYYCCRDCQSKQSKMSPSSMKRAAAEAERLTVKAGISSTRFNLPFGVR